MSVQTEAEKAKLARNSLDVIAEAVTEGMHAVGEVHQAHIVEGTGDAYGLRLHFGDHLGVRVTYKTDGAREVLLVCYPRPSNVRYAFRSTIEVDDPGQVVAMILGIMVLRGAQRRRPRVPAPAQAPIGTSAPPPAAPAPEKTDAAPQARPSFPALSGHWSGTLSTSDSYEAFARLPPMLRHLLNMIGRDRGVAMLSSSVFGGRANVAVDGVTIGDVATTSAGGYAVVLATGVVDVPGPDYDEGAARILAEAYVGLAGTADGSPPAPPDTGVIAAAAFARVRGAYSSITDGAGLHWNITGDPCVAVCYVGSRAVRCSFRPTGACYGVYTLESDAGVTTDCSELVIARALRRLSALPTALSEARVAQPAGVGPGTGARSVAHRLAVLQDKHGWISAMAWEIRVMTAVARADEALRPNGLFLRARHEPCTCVPIAEIAKGAPPCPCISVTLNERCYVARLMPGDVASRGPVRVNGDDGVSSGTADALADRLVDLAMEAVGTALKGRADQ